MVPRRVRWDGRRHGSECQRGLGAATGAADCLAAASALLAPPEPFWPYSCSRLGVQVDASADSWRLLQLPLPARLHHHLLVLVYAASAA